MANTKIDKRTVKKGQSKTKNEPKSSYFQKIHNFWKGSNDSAPTDNSDNMSKAEITRFCIGAVLLGKRPRHKLSACYGMARV